MSGTAATVLFALPGLIDLCIKYGEMLRDRLDLFMTADSHSSLQTIVVDIVEGNIKDMLSFFNEVSEQLEPGFSDQLEELLRILASTLAKTISAFPKVDDLKMGVVAKAKYAMYDAKKIERSCQELELWHDRFLKRASIHMQFVFYPKYGQFHAPTSSPVSTTLRDTPAGTNTNNSDLTRRVERIRLGRKMVTGPLLISHDSIRTYERVDAFSPLWKSHSNSSEERESLVEYRSYGGADSRTVETIRGTVRNVAAELRLVDASTMSILECQGFSEDPLNKTFRLHFSIPEGMEHPRSLRSLLSDERNRRLGKKHSITDRIQLAQSITTAVLYVHSCGFVHKNVRPENIIVFEPALSDNMPEAEKRLRRFPYTIGRPFLSGYDGIRDEKAVSSLADVTDWKRLIYLAPDRLGKIAVRKPFTWKYDVYSLGVVLLEIALWEDFTDGSGRVGKLLKESPDEMRPVVLMNQTKQVPRLLGNRYADAVMACLRMLENEEASGKFKDEDGVLIGTSFISQVMSKLEEVVV
ncbi:hypothetical protein BDD12DRAFT_793371 [Trichophaea hybrida]|nr:hypothetical protein BDD12DRAFT_793371 [Trichophaea hybrida]